MPTKTFFNLPEEKQLLLLDSAKKEFSRVTFNEASINQMVQEAHISRGSFYMYFEDKEDIYLYLLSQYRKDLYHKFITFLINEKGDLISCFEKLYDEVITFCNKDETVNFFKNIFLNMKYATDKIIWFKPADEEMQQNKRRVLQILDKTKFKHSSEEDLEDNIALVMMITTSSLVCIFMNPLESDKERNIYYRRLSKLKQGLYN